MERNTWLLPKGFPQRSVDTSRLGWFDPWSAKEKVETLAFVRETGDTRGYKIKEPRCRLYPQAREGTGGLLHQHDAAGISLPTGDAYEAASIELVCAGECGFACADECNRFFRRRRRCCTNAHGSTTSNFWQLVVSGPWPCRPDKTPCICYLGVPCIDGLRARGAHRLHPRPEKRRKLNFAVTKKSTGKLWCSQVFNEPAVQVETHRLARSTGVDWHHISSASPTLLRFECNGQTDISPAAAPHNVCFCSPFAARPTAKQEIFF